MLTEMAKDVDTKRDDEGKSAAELKAFVEKARHGAVMNDDIVKFAKLFHDDLTLDNMYVGGGSEASPPRLPQPTKYPHPPTHPTRLARRMWGGGERLGGRLDHRQPRPNVLLPRPTPRAVVTSTIAVISSAPATVLASRPPHPPPTQPTHHQLRYRAQLVTMCSFMKLK